MKKEKKEEILAKRNKEKIQKHLKNERNHLWKEREREN